MAMASAGTKIVPESASKEADRLNISILSLDCEEQVDGPISLASKAGHAQSLSDALPSKAFRSSKGFQVHSLDVNSDSLSSSSSSYKSKLPMVLEESESFSHSKASSIWDTSSSSSSLSSVKSSSSGASSISAFFRRGASVDKGQKTRKQQKLQRRRNEKETSLVCLLLWPLKKVRDGYMSCIMGFDGAGDLSGLAQGATFATSTMYFADVPISKTDARNHG